MLFVLPRLQLEQEIEDYNAPLRFANQLRRRVFVLPLDANFEVPATDFSHGRLQHGDKIALPPSLGYQLLGMRLQPPWQFEIKRWSPADGGVEQREGEAEAAEEAREEDTDIVQPKRARLDRVFGSPLAFSAAENFIFVPNWMMEALDMQPFDVAEVRCVKLKMASSVSLQPHSSRFATIPNQQAVLENELRHYSALTAGTTISFVHNGELYKFDVVETKSGRATVAAVCVQDSDVATNILPARKPVATESQ